MANRFVYVPSDKAPYYKEEDTVFQFFSGFSNANKLKCIKSLHGAYVAAHHGAHILEVSSKGEDDLGKRFSAFNLKLKGEEKERTVEVLFQGSKVLACVLNGEKLQPKGVYDMTPREAKRKIKDYTDPDQPYYKLAEFSYFGKVFPLEPKNYFYNWLYIRALVSNPEEAEAVTEFDAFTNIEFNPKKAYNCQAAAVAAYVGLKRAGKLEEALKSPEDFLSVVYEK